MKVVAYKDRKLIIPIILSLVLIIIAVITYFLIYKKDTPTPIGNTSNRSTLTEKPVSNTIHFAAMGDMLAHDTIINNAKSGEDYDFSKFFSNIRSSYQDADVVFCNQEGLSSGEEYGISGYPSFNAPTKFAKDLQSGAGCNLINLANNHMGDKGVNAISDTVRLWQGLKPLGFSGANLNDDMQNQVSYFELNGIKIGFVAFADFNNNQNLPAYAVNNYHDEVLVRKLVTDARSNADVVIVSMHWGVEDSNIVSNDQESEIDLLSSLGVDVVIGTGPHVLQRVQVTNRNDGGKIVVFYSLGNMLSSQLLTKELIGGIAKFDITKLDSGKIDISNLIFVPTYMHYEWTAAQEASGDLLARKNAMIYLLKNSSLPLSKSLLNTTIEEQKQYIVDTLGTDITVQ
jgi:poly-gamma-glutamate synthesis protein (capsule biosynthesis protein)